MTTKEFAQMLNGREYLNEITREEAELARENGIVVVYGASDDLVELRGAIEDEFGAYDGTTLYFFGNGLISPDDNEEIDLAFLKKVLAHKTIAAEFGEGEYAWTYQTEIPHETFEIFEDGERYCKGIVFYLSEIEDAHYCCPFCGKKLPETMAMISTNN